jgi:DNA repair protein RecN (Recombination protein N)
MITSLHIENFALIDKLSMNFPAGFSIITGETGAGKSILLGALGLALGNRADLSSLKNKDEKCIIEAQFRISGYDLQTFFDTNDLDYDDDTIIRREILPSGKSRAFVNDSPVNLQELQALSEKLIDIHSQHETRELSDESFQFAIIDAIAANRDNLTGYATKLKEYKKHQSELETVKQKRNESIKEQDYNAFLLDELLAANLKVDDQHDLESSAAKLGNVEFIRENLDRSLGLANDEQFGIIQNFKEFKAALQKIASLSDEYQTLTERTTSLLIEFDDIAADLQRAGETLNGDPAQLELVNQKLQTIYSLQKKHQVATVRELIDIQSELDQKIVSVSDMETQIAQLEQEIGDNEKELDALAQSIHDNRLKAIPVFSGKMTEILALLGMPNVRFKIEVSAGPQYFSNGKDQLQFLFSANKGSDFGLLKKVASGGEMSRIMLAVKSILSQYSSLPTIIFDEIDTGVSGEIANKMAEIMKGMSAKMQVFAITHLPQIAATGAAHFKVFKTVSGGTTQSELKLLTPDERVIEIAQMLSGAAVSDSAINHARALLN